MCVGGGDGRGRRGDTNIQYHQYYFRFQQVAVVVMIVLIFKMRVYMPTVYLPADETEDGGGGGGGGGLATIVHDVSSATLCYNRCLVVMIVFICKTGVYMPTCTCFS